MNGIRYIYRVLLMMLLHIVYSNGLRMCPRRSNTKQLTRLFSTESFFHDIGSPRFISAPMVEQSSLPFRLLVRKYNVGLAFTEMIHAKHFISSKKVRDNKIDWIHSGHVIKQDSPLIVQLAGDDPYVLVEAGRYLQDIATAIDLNLGCPQKIAKKGNYGAYLLQNKQLVLKILSIMTKSLKCPVTAKIRILSNEKETIDYCKALESCGIAMLTVHGRTVDQNKLYTGEANWNIIKDIKNQLRIPVISNGGISNYDDAVRCLDYTNADGVMSSEALLENPKLFSAEGNHLFHNDYIRNQLETTHELIQLFQQYSKNGLFYDGINEDKLINIGQLRGHLFKILYRLIEAPKNNDLRSLLADGNMSDIMYVYNQLHERLSSVNYEDNENTQSKGYIISTSWYNRHRDEKAGQRILSRKKIITWNGRKEDSSEDVEYKLEQLRKRLEERKKSMVINSESSK